MLVEWKMIKCWKRHFISSLTVACPKGGRGRGAMASPVGKLFGGNQPVGGISREGCSRCLVGGYASAIGVLSVHLEICRYIHLGFCRDTWHDKTFMACRQNVWCTDKNCQRNGRFSMWKYKKISRSLRSLLYAIVYFRCWGSDGGFSLLHNIICNLRYYRHMIIVETHNPTRPL